MYSLFPTYCRINKFYSLLNPFLSTFCCFSLSRRLVLRLNRCQMYNIHLQCVCRHWNRNGWGWIFHDIENDALATVSNWKCYSLKIKPCQHVSMQLIRSFYQFAILNALDAQAYHDSISTAFFVFKCCLIYLWLVLLWRIALVNAVANAVQYRWRSSI